MTVETGKRSIGGKFGRLLQLCSFAFAICLATQIAKASVVVNFDDIPDTVTFTGDARATGSCGLVTLPPGGSDPFSGAFLVEQCVVNVAAPTGMTTSSNGTLTIGEGFTAQNELLLSDFMSWSTNTTGDTVTILFESDATAAANDVIPQCPGGVKCQVDETGLNGQAAFTIHWSSATGGSIDDQVTFGSDTIPEPSSLILLGSALLGVAGVVRKRSRQS